MTILSKKKQPDREKHRVKEELRIENGVFDNRTMYMLEKLYSKGVVAKLQFIIARGKEADVYLGDAGTGITKEFVALKIFRRENARFQNKMKYISGDPRFGKVKANVFSIVNEWCKKEYANLIVAAEAGVHAPKPYAFRGNILVMEFIGNEGTPSNTLREVTVSDPEKVLDAIIEDMKKLYAAELVHADMSEYNILMLGEVPYLIDFGQAVHIKHPNSMAFLERDVENLLHYFSIKYGIRRERDATLKRIKE